MLVKTLVSDRRFKKLVGSCFWLGRDWQGLASAVLELLTQVAEALNLKLVPQTLDPKPQTLKRPREAPKCLGKPSKQKLSLGIFGNSFSFWGAILPKKDLKLCPLLGFQDQDSFGQGPNCWDPNTIQSLQALTQSPAHALLAG